MSAVECSWCMGVLCVLFFFKQKTAYEMRISDWSSDVCSSDLDGPVDLQFQSGLPRCADALRVGTARRDAAVSRVSRVAPRTRAPGPIPAPNPGSHTGFSGDEHDARVAGERPGGPAHHGDRKSTRLNSSH